MKEKETGKLKVLCVGDKGANFYHRCIVPYTALIGQKVTKNGGELEISVDFNTFNIGKTEYKEEDFKNYDVIVNTWLINTEVSQIGVWRNHYDCIWINDFDDVVPDHKHPYYTEAKKLQSKARIIQTCLEADAITVATPVIADYLFNENKFMQISPNFLPYGTGQFEINEYKPVEDKLRIGILGSHSHLSDYQAISGIIKKIANDSEIHKNAKFVIYGYVENNKIWTKIKNIFQCNKAMEVELHPQVNVENYMEIYKNVDIVLAPLEDNFFNKGKSGLKLAEAVCNNIPIVGSDLYMSKELKGLCACKKPLDYYTFIKMFVKNRQLIVDYGKQLAEINKNDSKWGERITNLKNLLEVVVSDDFQKERDEFPENVKIWGITYSDNQKTEYIPYDNSNIKTIEQKSYLFEYNPIIDILSNKIDNLTDEDYIGIFSYKFPQKTYASKRMLSKVLERANYNEYDVISLSPSKYFDGDYLHFTESQHPGFMELFNLICKDLGLEVKEPEHIIYSNFYLAKKQIYTKFVTEIINPAIELMETKYKDLAWKNANYTVGLRGEKLKEQTELDFYPMHPFLLERLLSVWLENNKQIKVNQLL